MTVEIKAAALTQPAPAAAGAASVAVDDSGTFTALVAVTGVRDDVDDIIEPGAFARTLRERPEIKIVRGHDWNRPAGQVTSAVELPPGDPRLPATAPDGSPWPRAAGALLVRGRFLLGTRDGHESHEIAKAFGAEQSFSIGYSVKQASKRGGVRYIRDLDLYEASPVLHGANRLARLLDVKHAAGAALERKSTSGASRLFATVRCALCGKGTGGTTTALPTSTHLICPACLAAVDQLATAPGDVVISRSELDEAEELTSEEHYAQALTDDVDWHLLADGTIAPGPASAWTPDPRAGRRP